MSSPRLPLRTASRSDAGSDHPEAGERAVHDEVAHRDGRIRRLEAERASRLAKWWALGAVGAGLLSTLVFGLIGLLGVMSIPGS